MREKSVPRIHAKHIEMVGQACYLIINSLDYTLKFNGQNETDIDNTKILLMMPMVPEKNRDKLKLNN